MTPHTETLRMTAPSPFEVKDTAQGAIEGLAAVFGGEPDGYGDVIERGAFRATLERHKAEGSQPVMLWAHDPARVVGRWVDLAETAEGLAVRGLFNLKTEGGREAFEHVRAGDLSGLSIGYRVVKADRAAAGARRLVEIDLAEVSVVALPANRRARVRSVKSEPVTLASRAALRDLLLDAGLARAAAEKVASVGWPALAAHDPETEAKAELARMIRATAAAFTTKGS